MKKPLLIVIKVLAFKSIKNKSNDIVFSLIENKKDVNRYSHIASSPISQSYFFEEVRCLILASSQRKLRGYIEFFKFVDTIKKLKNSNPSKI